MSLLRLLQHLPRERFECRVITFRSDGSAGALRKQFPCPVEYWPLNNVYDFSAMRAALGLRRLVRQQGINIVHTFFPTSDLWAGPIAKLSGAQVLVSSRRDMGFSRTAKEKIGYRLLKGLFDQIQTVSDSVRQYTIAADRVHPGRIRTIYNGVGPGPDVTAAEVDNLRRTLEFQPGMPVIGCVANWRREKGLDVLVRAADLVLRQIPEARFFVAGLFGFGPGDHGFTERVQELNRSLVNERKIRFLGASVQVPALLALSDIFVLPSRTEGFSNALLEAMRAGLPCVATSVGGNPEAVVDGITGFLVPPDRPEEMADSILKLLRSPDMRQRMGASGRNRVIRKFSVEAMVSAVIAEYTLLLESRNIGRGFDTAIVPGRPSGTVIDL